LSNHPQIEVVGHAVDGQDALRKIAALRPDVVTLDVEMPNLNGIGVLERAAGKLPVAFLMVSTLTDAGARVTLEALRKGAFDYVPKPQTSGASPAEFEAELHRKVLAASRAKGRARRLCAGAPETTAPRLPPNQIHGWVVALGISCGGPQTLSQMLPAFPSDFVPIVVTQHMPAQFTGPFAAQLDSLCAMQVQEARHGALLEQGTIYIAPGSHHLKIVRAGIELRIELDDGPKVSGHRPAVDAMFDSLARACATRCIAAVMTGMGSDGAAGTARLHAAGAWTLAQDAETSLVYGMPKAAAETGAVDQVVALGQIPAAIARLLHRGPRTRAMTSAGASACVPGQCLPAVWPARDASRTT
jgi:two-component system chemotaxis response regulator CheB